MRNSPDAPASSSVMDHESEHPDADDHGQNHQRYAVSGTEEGQVPEGPLPGGLRPRGARLDNHGWADDGRDRRYEREGERNRGDEPCGVPASGPSVPGPPEHDPDEQERREDAKADERTGVGKSQPWEGRHDEHQSG